MAKTAEEILREELAKKTAELREDPIEQEDWDDWKEEQGPEFMEVMWKSYRQFAAQEVEEYKTRLKRLIGDQHYSNSSMAKLSFQQIIELIDTVK